jgi:hypothetical protein
LQASPRSDIGHWTYDPLNSKSLEQFHRLRTHGSADPATVDKRSGEHTHKAKVGLKVGALS